MAEKTLKVKECPGLQNVSSVERFQRVGRCSKAGKLLRVERVKWLESGENVFVAVMFSAAGKFQKGWKNVTSLKKR